MAAYIFKLETSGMSIRKGDRQTPVLRIHEFEMTFFKMQTFLKKHGNVLFQKLSDMGPFKEYVTVFGLRGALKLCHQISHWREKGSIYNNVT